MLIAPHFLVSLLDSLVAVLRIEVGGHLVTDTMKRD
jgi:hypothetical protein